MFSTCNNDDSFGPGVSGCRDDFDFTIGFEQLVFSVVPSALFIILAIWRIALFMRRPQIVHAPTLRLVKLGTIAILAALEFVLLILAAIRSLDITSLAIASTALRFVAALCMIPLSVSDHGRLARPSVLLSIYLFPTLLLDAAQTRTYWLAASTRPEVTYTAIFTASLSLKATILILEARSKTKWLNIKEPYSPEETSSIYSLGVFFWLNKIFLTGYRKVMDLKDLYPLDRAIGGEALYKRFQKHAVYSKMQGDKHGLAKALVRTLRVPIMFVILPRLALTAFTFCQPFLINSILDRLSQPVTDASVNVGYGLIGATALIYAGIAVSTALYWYFHYRTLLMARGVLVTAIYTKATQAQIGPGDSSASLTLMSVDIERIVIGFSSLHEAWAGNIEVVLASWLLYNKVGAAFAAPIVIVVLCFLALSVIVKFTGNAQRMWMAGVQKRVGLTSTVISNMKNIKVSGLAAPITEFVQNLRVDELNAGSRLRKLNLITTALAFGPLFVSPIMTFAIAQRTLDATTLFTSLSWLVLLATPLTNVIKTIQLVMSGLACLGRIQAFLESPPRKDYRLVPSNANQELEKVSIDTIHAPNRRERGHANPAITVSNGRFGWEEDTAVLNGIDIKVPESSLTIVVGPIGSGKSTLCKSLLGEIPFSRGSVAMSTKIGRVAYCDQTPFLSNSSIRNNILGFSPFDHQRYADVIDATMLRLDFETLPQGDETNIGSNGITLSGGQKQRISLARALYLHSDLLILDDVFSGLDAETEEYVFSRVFGAGGIIQRRQATVVLCTHSVRHLPSAGHIIVLGIDGSVVEQGSFEDLVANENYVHSLRLAAQRSESDSDTSESKDSLTDIKPTVVGLASSTTPVVPKVPATARQLGDWTVYKHYFKSMGLVLAGSLFWWAALYGFFYNFPTIWLKYWSDDDSTNNPRHSFSYYMGIYAFLQSFCLVSLVALGYFIWVTSIKKSGAHLHHDALRTMIGAPLQFFTTTDQGVITNLFSQDLNLVDTELPNALLNFLCNFAIAIGQAAVMITTSPYIAISYPFLLFLMWLIQKFYLRTSRQLRILDLETKSPLYTHFIDTTRGIVTIRAFNYVSEEHSKSVALLDDSQRPFYLLLMVQQWLTLVLNLIVMVLAIILVTLALQLRSNSGFAGASLVTLMSFGDSLSSIVMQWTKLETSIGAIGRLRTFSDTVEPESMEGEDISPPVDWPPRGQIDFQGVSASYDTGTPGEELNLALNEVHLSISPGEKVALCGRTGSGKSSIIALLLKLLNPTEDTRSHVYIDNAPLHRIDRQALRLRLIAIPQDAVFLPDGSTFQQNLDPLDVADATECRAALELVGLWVVVEERGGLDGAMKSDTLSQGQRQLFSVAHAVLRRRIRARSLGITTGGGSNGGVLLLDEVTSSVDQETESIIQNIIKVEFQDYTILAVSHRLRFVMDFDRVVVMDRGKVVEVGNPKELAEGDTRFGDLWRAGGR
ncbi:P-loop containing nucleoside triphosphate hydrolase protein [Truncatella angustata]|uniref:P-loop containing nucleoside triphosphate hydrolase protein n=1 Tax=Truncatella angustata TaxID=152316 RepID=A0A9P8UB85_9PEZI|nr:P-loop containing nucleoside triphosphate hydrolase protein [Truncatella angustata]KAH6640025.1 P-loop containing nucleoside triphosphate hydrolase protein [Truncatella angustata]